MPGQQENLLGARISSSRRKSGTPIALPIDYVPEVAVRLEGAGSEHAATNLAYCRPSWVNFTAQSFPVPHGVETAAVDRVEK